MKRLYRRPLRLIALGVVAVFGCGPDDGGGLALKIHYTLPERMADVRVAEPAPKGEAPLYITDYRICVFAADMSALKCKDFNRADHRTGARLGGLKPGEDRRVTFWGYDREKQTNPVVWCGTVSGIRIRANKTTRVSMNLTACSDFTPLCNECQMSVPRAFHTATKLPDGRVLVVGGFSSIGSSPACPDGQCHALSATSSIDIYNPLTGSFEDSGGLALRFARGLHTASLLPDGRVLVAGGAAKAILRVDFPQAGGGGGPVIEVDNSDNGLAGRSAELIDPTAGAVQEITMAQEDPSRAHHAAVSLPGDVSNGDVVLIGGIEWATNVAVNSMSRFRTASQDWIPCDETSQAARQGMAIAPFGARSFLIWGGNDVVRDLPNQFAEVLYVEQDSTLGVRTPELVDGDSAYRGIPAYYAAAAALDDARLLFSGGMIVDADYDARARDRVIIIDSFRVLDMTVDAESFVDTAERTMLSPRAFHTATRLGRSAEPGEVLVVGGLTYFDQAAKRFTLTDQVEFLAPDELTFADKRFDSQTISMNRDRAGHSAVELNDGTVLLTGGLTAAGTDISLTETAEIYNPTSRSLPNF